LFTFEPGIIVWTLVSFLIAFWVISAYVYPPVRRLLDERQLKIADHLNAAQKKQSEAEVLFTQADEKIRGIKLEEHRILSEAREKANQLYRQYEQKALEDFRKLRTEKEQELLEMERAFLINSEAKITELISQMCEKVLRIDLTAEQHNAIIRAKVAELEKLKSI
jgi:F-type H+-transporting ATPase subunit b